MIKKLHLMHGFLSVKKKKRIKFKIVSLSISKSFIHHIAACYETYEWNAERWDASMRRVLNGVVSKMATMPGRE